MNICGFEPRHRRLWLLMDAPEHPSAVDVAAEVWLQQPAVHVTCLGSAEGLLTGAKVPVKRVKFQSFVREHVKNVQEQLLALDTQKVDEDDAETLMAHKVVRGMLLDGLAVIQKKMEDLARVRT